MASDCEWSLAALSWAAARLWCSWAASRTDQRQRLNHVVEAGRPVQRRQGFPGGDRPLFERLCPVRDDKVGVKASKRTQPVAVRARALGTVEAEGPGLNLAQAGAATRHHIADARARHGWIMDTYLLRAAVSMDTPVPQSAD